METHFIQVTFKEKKIQWTVFSKRGGDIPDESAEFYISANVAPRGNKSARMEAANKLLDVVQLKFGLSQKSIRSTKYILEISKKSPLGSNLNARKEAADKFLDVV